MKFQRELLFWKFQKLVEGHDELSKSSNFDIKMNQNNINKQTTYQRFRLVYMLLAKKKLSVKVRNIYGIQINLKKKQKSTTNSKFSEQTYNSYVSEARLYQIF